MKLGPFFARLREKLRNSGLIHIREANITTQKELASLIDRLFNDELAYPLEWDDFVSWEHENPNIERQRQKINELSVYFVGSPKEREEGAAGLKEIRDGLLQ